MKFDFLIIIVLFNEYLKNQFSFFFVITLTTKQKKKKKEKMTALDNLIFTKKMVLYFAFLSFYKLQTVSH